LGIMASIAFTLNTFHRRGIDQLLMVESGKNPANYLVFIYFINFKF